MILTETTEINLPRPLYENVDLLLPPEAPSTFPRLRIQAPHHGQDANNEFELWSFSPHLQTGHMTAFSRTCFQASLPTVSRVYSFVITVSPPVW